ncbi:MAG: 5'-methylthioadenosine/adenosylhomocysteine nucleosidase [Desulfobacterales bacterium]|nr:5'-methylthioadenosine/adenosylhomocysteine nucleosidase [Desulfobacterales bacterium]
MIKNFRRGCLALFIIFISIKSTFADVGIIVGLNSSLKQLTKNLRIAKISRKAGRQFYSGRINDVQVVLVRSPMGKVNNAITAQLLLSHYSIQSVISIAPAGALSKKLNIGDGIIATKLYQHDFGTVKRYGFIWNRVPDGTNWDVTGYNEADKKLRESALLYPTYQHGNKILEGIMVTGDQFISSPDKSDWLFKKFKAIGVDMGAAAIAQVCFANQVPFCIMRIITDKAGITSRTDFERSIPVYRSDINISEFVANFLDQIKNKR